ncbi:hypothetical protein [Novosphingobium sp. SG916]|nr:hypothetical protein [Novosphingobium sp. SG916]NMN07552.1 hypothetical protein [Novosphingobium sp. SG919]
MMWRLMLVAVGCIVLASPAQAQVAAVGNAVMAELMALVGPAIKLGIIWIGYLVMQSRGSVQLVVTFLIGAAIVLAGGYLV